MLGEQSLSYSCVLNRRGEKDSSAMAGVRNTQNLVVS